MRSWIYNHAMSRNSLEPRGYRVREGFALALTALFVAAVFLSLSLTGCGEETPPPLPVEEEQPAVEFISGLSAEQSRAVDELGYPDHFFISFDPASSDRVERWTYFSQGKALDFDNGRLFGEEPIEDESAAYPPTDLRPQDFNAMMTPGEAVQLLGEPLYTQEVQDSLMPENTIVVYDKAVLLYRGEQLIGVDTQVSPPKLNGL